MYNYNDYLMHYGVKGMKWGVRRYTNPDGSLTPRAKKKIAKAEKYLGRKLQTMDGFSEDGSDITRKGLKNVKQWDEQEKRYKEVRKKGDPAYSYVRGHDLTYHNSLSVKDVDRIIKKMDKDPSLNVLNEVEKAHRMKAYKKTGKEVVGRVLTTSGSMLISAAAIDYINRR